MSHWPDVVVAGGVRVVAGGVRAEVFFLVFAPARRLATDHRDSCCPYAWCCDTPLPRARLTRFDAQAHRVPRLSSVSRRSRRREDGRDLELEEIHPTSHFHAGALTRSFCTVSTP